MTCAVNDEAKRGENKYMKSLDNKRGGSVEVLLSTYNGDKYIGDLLGSLLKQTYNNITMRFRDDGSRDETKKILRNFSLCHQNVFVEYGENVGVSKSFLRLLLGTSGKADYYAFCDQDDIWMPGKVERAVQRLELIDSSTPALYCSRLELVDSNLKHLKYTRKARCVGFGNALVHNIATGCTIVINKAARNIITENLPVQTIMHDSWLYLVVAAFGEVVYDEISNIKYRQHGSNVVGGNFSFRSILKERISRFVNRRRRFMCSDQALEFYRLYGNQLSAEKTLLLKEFLEGKSNRLFRVKLVFNRKIWRQNRIDDLVMRVLIALNSY